MRGHREMCHKELWAQPPSSSAGQGAGNALLFQGFHSVVGKGLPKVAGDAGWLPWSCISPVAPQFCHFPPVVSILCSCWMSDLNRLWVLSQSAWRSGAATQSTLDFQRKEPNQAETVNFIKLHIDGSVIVLTLISATRLLSLNSVLLGQPIALALSGFNEWINLIIND